MRAILLSILLCFFGSQYALAVERQIDPEQSTLTIHVGKSGLLSAAAHEYTVTAPIANGTIDDGVSAEISFRVEAIRLTVLPEEHRSKIQHTMQERVLESSCFPEIYFASGQGAIHSRGRMGCFRPANPTWRNQHGTGAREVTRWQIHWKYDDQTD
jgi:hypothetical protein